MSVTAPTLVSVTATDFLATIPSGTATATTASIAVQAGDVVVAVGNSESSHDGGLTIGGGGLTWTQQQQINEENHTNQVLATATVGSSGTITVTVTRGTTSSAHRFGVSALVFRGSAGVGVTAKATGSGAPSATLTGCAAGSAVVAIVGDWDGRDGSGRVYRAIDGVTPASGSGEYLYQSATGVTVYGVVWSPTSSSGDKVAGLTTPSNMSYAISAIEVLGASGPLFQSAWARGSNVILQ